MSLLLLLLLLTVLSVCHCSITSASSSLRASSQCRHLDHVLLQGGARGEVRVALGSGHRGRGDADDGCGDLAALAVQRRLLVHSHVQAGAAAKKSPTIDDVKLYVILESFKPFLFSILSKFSLVSVKHWPNDSLHLV